MSKEIKKCDIVLELLPLYIEQRTGEESNHYIKAHLAECADCREAYEWMNMDISQQLQDGAVQGDAKHSQKKGIHLSPANKRILVMLIALLGYIGLMVLIVIGTILYFTGI